MKKSKKILLASILAAGFTLGGAMALNTNVATAANSAFNGIDFTSVVMSDGASVRVANDNNYGIRFQMNMDETTYTALEEKGASYGVAIYPADYGYTLTESVIFAANSEATFVESETLSDMNEDGTYDMWGSLVNIQPNNVTREFVGIGYVRIGTEYKLANAYQEDIANNTRSIYYVAQRAVVENDKNAAAAKAQYIDTYDTTGKEYAYTVNHIYKNTTGEVVKTETETLYGTLNSTATVTPNDGWYKHEAANSKVSDTLYANGKTTLTVVYRENTAVANYNKEYVKLSAGKILLDTYYFDVAIPGFEKVYVDGVEVTLSNPGGTQVEVPATAGVHQIAVYGGDECYYCDVKVADYVITDQASLKGWNAVQNTAKYAVVANDVVCDGSDMVDWGTFDSALPMTGTFDGLGYTISNANYYGGILNNGNMKAGSVIKNVTFENLTVYSMYYALFGRYMEGGLVENVNATVVYTAFDTTNGGLITNIPCGLVVSGVSDTFRNVNLKFTVPEADVDKVAKLYKDEQGYYGTIMENVTIDSNGKVAKEGETWESGEGVPAITMKNSSWTNVTITDADDKEKQIDNYENDVFVDDWVDNATKPISLKVGTYNIEGCAKHNADGSVAEINPTATGQLIKTFGLDIIGLQEVFRKSGAGSAYTDQTAKLSNASGMQYYEYGESTVDSYGDYAGNAILSKYRIIDVTTYLVPAPTEDERRPEETQWYGDRIIVKTTVDVGREICFITTHFGLNGLEQELMVEKLIEVLDAETRPVILCGDFNAVPDQGCLKPIYARLQNAADLTGNRYTPTFASYDPSGTIDYIFVSKEFTVKSFEAMDIIHSDHRPLWAELEICI